MYRIAKCKLCGKKVHIHARANNRIQIRNGCKHTEIFGSGLITREDLECVCGVDTKELFAEHIFTGNILKR